MNVMQIPTSHNDFHGCVKMFHVSHIVCINDFFINLQNGVGYTQNE